MDLYCFQTGISRYSIHFENKVCSIPGFIYQELYNDFNVYCRELAPSTVNLTGDRAQGKDNKHCACSTHWKHLERVLLSCQPRVTVTSCFIYKVIRDV